MKILAAVLLLGLVPSAATADPAPTEAAVAVVSSLSGQAFVTGSDRARRPLGLFDWLPVGSSVEVASGASLVLALADGRRYGLEGGARVVLGSAGPKSVAGSLRALARVPPMPAVVAIDGATRAGERSAAVRLRSAAPKRITRVYPRAGVTTLPDATVLSFSPVEEAAGYAIEVEDEGGYTVLKIQTQRPELAVPSGVLKPGAQYFWNVRTVSGAGLAPARRDADFMTLREEDIARRAALKAALEQKGDAASQALLGAIDTRLGLLAEARDEFQAALAKAPDDATIRGALAALESRLAEDGDGSESP